MTYQLDVHEVILGPVMGHLARQSAHRDYFEVPKISLFPGRYWGVLREASETHAEDWIAWARAPGHDSYWRFHRDALLPLVPSPGSLTLDVGCGEGRLGRDLARLGHHVIELDASPAMARAAWSHPEAVSPVILGDASALPLAAASADCVVAFMCLQDVDEMEMAVREVARVLQPGGRLVVAITHLLNTAGEFAAGPDESSPLFVIAGSSFERRRLADTSERGGLQMTFHSEHRPLEDYAAALAAAGFLIEQLREIGEPDRGDKWHRIPLFLHIRAIRS